MPDERPIILMIKRHHQTLSEAETNELVSAMAELVVNYLKSHRKKSQPKSARPLEAKLFMEKEGRA